MTCPLANLKRHHYRDFLRECGWIDQACVITAEGRKALRETEGRR